MKKKKKKTKKIDQATTSDKTYRVIPDKMLIIGSLNSTSLPKNAITPFQLPAIHPRFLKPSPSRLQGGKSIKSPQLDLVGKGYIFANAIL
jgi:hypothetical protein